MLNWVRNLLHFKKRSEKGGPRLDDSVLEKLETAILADVANEEQSRRRRAEAGDSVAQYGLGVLLLHGAPGIQANHEEALGWFQKAASQGHPGAKFTLGAACKVGAGLPQDAQMAAEYFKEAATLGETNAQFELALMYKEGLGVPQDHSIAAHLLESVVRHSTDLEKWFRACIILGTYAFEGLGCSQSYVRAHVWFNIAAALAPEAIRDMAVTMRKTVSKQMTKDQISDAQERAEQWLKEFQAKQCDESQPGSIPLETMNELYIEARAALLKGKGAA